MKKQTKFALLAGLGLFGTGFGLAFWTNFSRWNAETARLIGKIQNETVLPQRKTVSFDEFEPLPAPVAKYLRLVLKENQPIIKTARIEQKGEFLLNDNWIPFTANEYFSIHPAAFLWDANMDMNPLLNVRVRDAFLDGKGSTKAKIASLLTVADAKNAPELDTGALQRFLGEAAWIPTALLPSENLSWSAIDERRALATLTESGTTVSLEFRFNEKGEIAEVYAPERFRETNGRFEKTPWRGRFWNYEERNEMLIPTEAEVEWQMEEKNVPYWKGRVENAVYEFAD